MSKQTIYDALRRGGMTREGALGTMGNIGAESAFISINVEDRCTMSDWDYTNNVMTGIIPKWEFVHDAYGYGLCQWTFRTRKEELYDTAMEKQVSIGDEEMQCEFLLHELSRDYSSLFRFLCETDNIYEAARRFCVEFERPAYNNVDARYAIALQCGEEVFDDDDDHGGCADDSCPIPEPIPDTCDITVRVLKQGKMGRDVYLLQCGLRDMGINCGNPDGDFGPLTEAAVNELKLNAGLATNGIADYDVWQMLFE